jgi:hypothetical protein
LDQNKTSGIFPVDKFSSVSAAEGWDTVWLRADRLPGEHASVADIARSRPELERARSKQKDHFLKAAKHYIRRH